MARVFEQLAVYHIEKEECFERLSAQQLHEPETDGVLSGWKQSRCEGKDFES